MSRVALDVAMKLEMLQDSYGRLPCILRLYYQMEAADFWKLLGRCWSVCDNISDCTSDLGGQPESLCIRQHLSRATREQLDCMMTSEELTALAKLPDDIIVYRGCYGNNQEGLSWTLKREIAERFPFLWRYRQEDEGAPLLLTGHVAKSEAVLKLCRNEFEIICPYVCITSYELLLEKSEERVA